MPTSFARAPMAALSRTSSLRVWMPAVSESAFSFPASMSVAHTIAPSRAKARAVAAPMPWPAAVTTQTLPFSLIPDLALLDQLLLLVELFRAGMQRNTDIDERRLEPDIAVARRTGLEQAPRA